MVRRSCVHEYMTEYARFRAVCYLDRFFPLTLSWLVRASSLTLASSRACLWILGALEIVKGAKFRCSPKDKNGAIIVNPFLKASSFSCIFMILMSLIQRWM